MRANRKYSLEAANLINAIVEAISLPEIYSNTVLSEVLFYLQEEKLGGTELQRQVVSAYVTMLQADTTEQGQ